MTDLRTVPDVIETSHHQNLWSVPSFLFRPYPTCPSFVISSSIRAQFWILLTENKVRLLPNSFPWAFGSFNGHPLIKSLRNNHTKLSSHKGVAIQFWSVKVLQSGVYSPVLMFLRIALDTTTVSQVKQCEVWKHWYFWWSDFHSPCATPEPIPITLAAEPSALTHGWKTEQVWNVPDSCLMMENIGIWQQNPLLPIPDVVSILAVDISVFSGHDKCMPSEGHKDVMSCQQFRCNHNYFRHSILIKLLLHDKTKSCTPPPATAQAELKLKAAEVSTLRFPYHANLPHILAYHKLFSSVY